MRRIFAGTAAAFFFAFGGAAAVAEEEPPRPSGEGVESSPGAPVGLAVAEWAATEAPRSAPASGVTRIVAPAAPAPVPTTTAMPVSADPYGDLVGDDLHTTVVATARPGLTMVAAHDAPDGSPVGLEFAVTNPTYFGSDLTLLVTAISPDGRWLEVQLPVRPNGTHAWVEADGFTLATHRYRARVDLGDRTVTVWDGETVVADTTAVIGRDTSPTPVGRFFVNDLVEKWPGSAYGPWILSLSGFSEVLDEFNGGIPVIAIHGTNRPDLMGGAHSNGCIRIPNEVVEVLASTVPMGTPVDIVA